MGILCQKCFSLPHFFWQQLYDIKVTGILVKIHINNKYLYKVKYLPLWILYKSFRREKKSCLPDTPNLLTCADSSINTHQRETNKEEKNLVLCHGYGVTCQVSCVMCHVMRHVSCVVYHMSQVACHLSPVKNANSHNQKPPPANSLIMHSRLVCNEPKKLFFFRCKKSLKPQKPAIV